MSQNDSKLLSNNFSDIYLGKDASWLSGMPNSLDPVIAPEDCRAELVEMRTQCDAEQKERGKGDFTIIHLDTKFRVSIMSALYETVYVLRRFPKEVPPLETQGIHSSYVEMLLRKNLTGLLIVCGAFAQGKTTMASAIVKSRISKHGGVAVTVEDPPEMPLEGRHGEGVCYQHWVNQGEFGQACRQASRWAPSIIFMGEIRDSEAAIEALRASINGRLVICTTHADTVAMGIERLFSLASAGSSSSEDVASLLSAGLLGVMHQKLVPDATGKKNPKISWLWLGDDESKGVRNTIKQKGFNQIENEVTLQRNRLLLRGE